MLLIFQELERGLFLVVLGTEVRRMDRHIRHVTGGFAPDGSQGLLFQLREVGADALLECQQSPPVGVDLGLGPLLTFVIARSSKPRRVLARDVGIIVTVQLCAGLEGCR